MALWRGATDLLGKALSYPVYSVSLGYNVLRNAWDPENYRWYDVIDEHLILGAVPTQAIVEQLVVDRRLGTVINLTKHFDGTSIDYQQLQVDHVRVEVLDFTRPSSEQTREILEVIQRTAARGKTTYVHCKAGRGRGAYIALWWMMRRNPTKTPQEVQAMLLEKRGQVVKNLYQDEAVLKFHSSLASMEEAQ